MFVRSQSSFTQLFNKRDVNCHALIVPSHIRNIDETVSFGFHERDQALNNIAHCFCVCFKRFVLAWNPMDAVAAQRIAARSSRWIVSPCVGVRSAAPRRTDPSGTLPQRSLSSGRHVGGTRHLTTAYRSRRPDAIMHASSRRRSNVLLVVPFPLGPGCHALCENAAAAGREGGYEQASIVEHPWTRRSKCRVSALE